MQRDNAEFVPLDESNLLAVARLSKECFFEPWTENQLREILKNDCYTVLTSFAGGELAGYIIMSSVLDEAELCSLAVAKPYRRQGLAGELIDRALAKRCKSGGIKKLFLEVRESNLAARALYTSLNFVEDGMRKYFYRNPTENAILMSKEVQ